MSRRSEYPRSIESTLDLPTIQLISASHKSTLDFSPLMRYSQIYIRASVPKWFAYQRDNYAYVECNQLPSSGWKGGLSRLRSTLEGARLDFTHDIRFGRAANLGDAGFAVFRVVE